MEKVYPNHILKGPRVVLKRISPKMTDEMFTLIENNRERLGEFLPVFKDITAEEEKDYLKELSQRWDNFHSFDYTIYVNNKIIGTACINKVDYSEGRFELGYWLDKEYEGQGYISETVKLLIKEARRLNFSKAIISCSTKNVKSAKVAKRLNFELKEVYFNEKYHRDSYSFFKEL